MGLRDLFGRKPTIDQFATDLIAAAEKAGVTGFEYRASESRLTDGKREVNLVNLFAEYSQASAAARPALFDKYVAAMASLNKPPVPKLWSLAQTRIFPLLRSRYEDRLVAIKQRNSGNAYGGRTAQPFLSHLELVLGYDHGQTVAQVQLATLTEWAVPVADALERSIDNLRALPPPRWQAVAPGLWKLESEAGYHESFLLIPRIFERLPAKGQALVMIPNRGVLLATGSDEKNGLALLLAAARKSIQGAPWPLCGELFRVTPSGVETETPDPANEPLFATIKRLDLAGNYEPQKVELQKSYGEAVFVATYSLNGKKDFPNESQSWCSWTEGVPSLLPITDMIVFVQDPKGTRKASFVPWSAAEAIVKHHFKATDEDPQRVRVDTFPTPEELAELDKHKLSR